MTIADQEEIKTHQVPERLLSSSLPTPHVVSLDTYRKLWKESVEDPDKFFGDVSTWQVI
jgi:acetyl-CoA synthetase